jgi:hypothetical protein
MGPVAAAISTRPRRCTGRPWSSRPGHPYALHDLFSALGELTRRMPGLSAQHLNDLGQVRRQLAAEQ